MALTGKIMDFFADKAMTVPAFPRTKVKAVSDDNGIGLGALLEGKSNVGHTHTAAEVDAQEKHFTVSCTLISTSWSSLTQTVSVSGVTANNTVLVTPAPESYTNYGSSGIFCSAQLDGTLTFECTETPTVDLKVNIMILN